MIRSSQLETPQETPNALRLPVALDAMGGDHAPEATVAGAVRAAKELDYPLLLVGDEASLRPELERHGPLHRNLTLVQAAEVIGMEESPAVALRKKRNSSLVVAAELVKQGKAGAMVSAGNSGAATGAALLFMGMIGEVDRPAIATVIPNDAGGKAVFLDAGATTDCRPRNLLEFALMGSIYAERGLGIASPRVALLSIGEEPSKGDALTKAAHDLLRQQDGINFIGNIEGNHLMSGVADVVVCDGFVGNVLLKATEGIAEFFRKALREKLSSSGLLTRLTLLPLRPALRSFRDLGDYAKYGGALLLGVNGICIISHGRSSPEAIFNAIRVAEELLENRVIEGIKASLHDLGPSNGKGS